MTRDRRDVSDDWATALIDLINAPGDEGELNQKFNEAEREMAPKGEDRGEPVTRTP